MSIGISHNILLARLATRRAKPGSSYHLTIDEVPAFVAPLDICDLHGFGWSTKQKAQEKLGTTSVGDLVKKSKGVLIDALGKGMGELLYNAMRGVDDKKLESDKPRKSVSCEINVGRLLSYGYRLNLTMYISMASGLRTMNRRKRLYDRCPLKSRNDWMLLIWLGDLSHSRS